MEGAERWGLGALKFLFHLFEFALLPFRQRQPPEGFRNGEL